MTRPGSRVPGSPADVPTVAVVGMGCSGALVVVHLLRRVSRPMHLVLFEPGCQPGRGAAYASGDERHLLNAPARSMSALADDPDHFVQWLGATGGKPDPGSNGGVSARSPAAAAGGVDALGDAFVPRRRYGEYLSDTLAAALAAPPPGVTVTWRRCRVRSIGSGGGRVVVTDDEGRVTEADDVVVATGPPPPAALDGHRLPPPWDAVVVRDPWRPGALADVPSVGDVLLLGTGLTMVDLAITLAGRPQHGFLHARSRRGRLPVPNSAGACRPLPPRAGPEPLTARGLLRALREEAAKAEVSGLDWRRAVSAFRSRAPSVWAGLSDDERRRAVRHLLGPYKVVRHRLPPAAAATVAGLVDEARLSVASGRLVAIGPAGTDSLGSPVVHVTLRHGGRLETLRVVGVVDCTGPAVVGDPGADGRPTAAPAFSDRGHAPLVTALVAEGVASRHPSGLGLAVDDDGRLRDAVGRVHRHLYGIGWSRVGALLEAEGVPEIRAQADRLALLLAGGRAAPGAAVPS